MRKYLALWLLQHGEGVVKFETIAKIEYEGKKVVGLPSVCLACLQENYIVRTPQHKNWGYDFMITEEGKEFLNQRENNEQYK